MPPGMAPGMPPGIRPPSMPTGVPGKYYNILYHLFSLVIRFFNRVDDYIVNILNTNVSFILTNITEYLGKYSCILQVFISIQSFIKLTLKYIAQLTRLKQ